jgi:S1-C subfamily serine protease
VVGINSMVSGGMALAVPSHVVARLLARHGERPVLGISAQEVPIPDALAALAHRDLSQVERQSAMLVMGVETGSPADRAGLLLGDLVFAVDGHPVEGSAGLLNALDGHFSGPLRVGLLRGGAPRELYVSFTEETEVETRERELVAA